jgi:PAS domain S-box-containing protein
LDAILLTHPDGTIFYANSAAEELYGYTQQEICNLGRIGIADTNDPNLQVIMDERARLGKSKGELTLIKKDGSKFPAEISTSLFKDKNGNANTFTTIRDINHRKQNEKQIEYHALLLSKVNDAVIGADSNFIITYWNNGAELMFGFTGKEAIGKSSVELLRPIYAPGEREIIINELKNNGTSKSTISTKHRNGTEIIVEVNSSRILDEQKDISGYVVVYRDITERKQVEKRRKELLESEQQLVEELQTSNEELQSVTEELHVSNEELQHQGEGLVKVNQALLESEKRMNRSQEIAHLGSWELDINNNCLSWSDEVYRIFGLQPQEFDATYEAFLDNIHPNDRDEVDKHIRAQYVREKIPMRLNIEL